MPVAVIVNWYGPYGSFGEFKEAMKTWSEKERTLYMALGSYNTFRYVGMTESPNTRPYGHPKLKDKANSSFYTGNIVTQGISGPRSRFHSPDLAISEHVLIYGLKPELNDKMKYAAPRDCVSVYSQFFRTDNEDIPHRPLIKFPTLIAFDSWTGELLRT